MMAIFARKNKVDADNDSRKREHNSTPCTNEDFVDTSLHLEKDRTQLSSFAPSGIAEPQSISQNILRRNTPSIDGFGLPSSVYLERGKQSLATKDHGYFQTSYSDSGYESAETPNGCESNTCNAYRDDSHSARSSSFEPSAREAGPTLSYQQKTTEIHLMPAKDAAPTHDLSGVVLPPVAMLDGFKVNKKGKVLDEEGDIIGVLFQGDLLDCVRQKANARGEVLDDRGRVVGRVRTVLRSAETPLLHPASNSTVIHGRDLRVPATVNSAKSLSLAAGDTPDDTRKKSRRGSEASIGALPPISASNQTALETIASLSGMKSVSDGHESFSTLANPVEKSKDVKSSSIPSVTFARPEYESIEAPKPDDIKPAKRPEPQQRAIPTFSRSNSRMSLNSMLANKTSDDGNSAYVPSLFSYKGEIPETDGPQNNFAVRRQAASIRSTSSQARPALNVKIAHVSSCAGQRRVHVTGESNGMSSIRPTMGTRTSMHSSYRRSPLNSNDVTPGNSPDGTDVSVSDDGKSPVSYHPPSPSMYAGRTAHTQSSASARTYFTHAGKITVQADDQVSAPITEPATVVQVVKPNDKVQPKEVEKKKSRFGLFGKKG